LKNSVFLGAFSKGRQWTFVHAFGIDPICGYGTLPLLYIKSNLKPNTIKLFLLGKEKVQT
jgi:hypothetical protein